jgi:hypothetical protein
MNQEWDKSKFCFYNINFIRIFSETGFTASYNDSIEELTRGIRTHLPKLIKSKV